jgi:hypothetical protein
LGILTHPNVDKYPRNVTLNKPRYLALSGIIGENRDKRDFVYIGLYSKREIDAIMAGKNNKGKSEALVLLSSLKHLVEQPTISQKQKAWLAQEAGLLDDDLLCKQAGLDPAEIEQIHQIANKYNQEKQA